MKKARKGVAKRVVVTKKKPTAKKKEKPKNDTEKKVEIKKRPPATPQQGAVRVPVPVVYNEENPRRSARLQKTLVS